MKSSTDAEIRSTCKERIEALEHWLRRLIDDCLSSYGDYFFHRDANGDWLIKRAIAEKATSRRASDPARYPRLIDAVLLDDAIAIICKPDLYALHFRAPLQDAFPDGQAEARTFLTRLLAPRNNLAHANSIGMRQAEQVVCYVNDVIDSLKSHYLRIGMQNQYNVPLILRVVDSFGNSLTRSQLSPYGHGGVSHSLMGDSRFHLRPGDVLSVEVEIDPSYSASGYSVRWKHTGMTAKQNFEGVKVVLPLTAQHVMMQFELSCWVTTDRDWHRLGHSDDVLHLYYRVLPPI